jgi:translation initiation factor IF-3
MILYPSNKAEAARFSPCSKSSTGSDMIFSAGSIICSRFLFNFGGERLLAKKACVSMKKFGHGKCALLGIMSGRDALQLAQERHLDLVEIAPTAKPPVCRIMDYGKYRYEQQKRDKEARKKQKTFDIKEVKLRPGIEDHDFGVKFKNAVRFLEDGDKVKVTIMFRGRELSHPELGEVLLKKMAEQLKDMAVIERAPKLEGRNMIMIVAPKATK